MNRYSAPNSFDGAIPTFALYGEAQETAASELVHIEEISARSAPRNWQIEAHRHQGLLQLLFVFSGSARVLADGVEHQHDAPLVVIIPPGVVHAFKFLPRTEGYVLTLDDAGLAATAEAGDALPPLFAALRGEADVLPLATDGPALVRRVHGLLEQIAAEFAQPNLGSARMFVWLVRALLLLLVREQLTRHADGGGEGRHAALLRRFKQLVDTHYAAHWPVAEYARALNLTENRLNRLCRRETGSSAFALVQARLLLEARRKLIFTATPVSQLAYELGFSDPAYFTRIFKKLHGVAPSTFRTLATGGRA